jgi:drug/metabolite transporter (DMT)-like permease
MKYLWVLFALLALFASGIHPILFKELKNYNDDIYILLSFIFLFTGILALIYIILNLKKYKNFVTKKSFNKCCLITLFTALIIIIFNVGLMQSIAIAPKISYTLLIINLNLLITIVLAYLFFNEKINYLTLFGIFIVLLGLSIVIYYNNEK